MTKTTIFLVLMLLFLVFILFARYYLVMKKFRKQQDELIKNNKFKSEEQYLKFVRNNKSMFLYVSKRIRANNFRDSYHLLKKVPSLKTDIKIIMSNLELKSAKNDVITLILNNYKVRLYIKISNNNYINIYNFRKTDIPNLKQIKNQTEFYIYIVKNSKISPEFIDDNFEVKKNGFDGNEITIDLNIMKNYQLFDKYNIDSYIFLNGKVEYLNKEIKHVKLINIINSNEIINKYSQIETLTISTSKNQELKIPKNNNLKNLSLENVLVQDVEGLEFLKKDIKINIIAVNISETLREYLLNTFQNLFISNIVENKYEILPLGSQVLVGDSKYLISGYFTRVGKNFFYYNARKLEHYDEKIYHFNPMSISKVFVKSRELQLNPGNKYNDLFEYYQSIFPKRNRQDNLFKVNNTVNLSIPTSVFANISNEALGLIKYYNISDVPETISQVEYSELLNTKTAYEIRVIYAQIENCFLKYILSNYSKDSDDMVREFYESFFELLLIESRLKFLFVNWENSTFIINDKSINVPFSYSLKNKMQAIIVGNDFYIESSITENVIYIDEKVVDKYADASIFEKTDKIDIKFKEEQ